MFLNGSVTGFTYEPWFFKRIFYLDNEETQLQVTTLQCNALRILLLLKYINDMFDLCIVF